MKAICLPAPDDVKLQEVPTPAKPEPEHLIIEMKYCAINEGDKAFIRLPLPAGAAKSLYDVYGVSGAGIVTAVGEGVPEAYKGKKVSVYRSLKPTDHTVGTWCSHAHLHFLNCVILPDDANLEEYSGSIVNIITPYAFLKQVSAQGHKGIIGTAGNSATGIALLGICLEAGFPLISIVRNEESKRKLEALGATHVVVQTDSAFREQLSEMGQTLATTAIFDGVGGEVLNKIIDIIPNNSVIYCYGYLGGATPLTVHTRVMSAKGITITPFSNFKTDTVSNAEDLGNALSDISRLIHLPPFKTKAGRKFTLPEIKDALLFTSTEGAKAILCPRE